MARAYKIYPFEQTAAHTSDRRRYLEMSSYCWRSCSRPRQRFEPLGRSARLNCSQSMRFLPSFTDFAESGTGSPIPSCSSPR